MGGNVRGIYPRGDVRGEMSGGMSGGKVPGGNVRIPLKRSEHPER